MQFYNTMSRKKETFTPVRKGLVGVYACGITAYALSHIGHARSAVAFDILVRLLRYKGYEVTFVRNFTDVDDKIIKRANDEGVSSTEIAETYIKAYHEDMDRLGVIRADIEPRATEHIQEMLNLTERLIADGKAYATPSGDVYFRVRSFPGYGKLSGYDVDELESGARVDVSEIKRDALDFALWKAQKPGEPAWPSPWGMGRPGWHVECSAMSMKYLGDTLDIHCGGVDLVFPHHENEIAQSEGATGKPFAKYWMHNGHININNQKMSKSAGNFFTVRDIAKEFDLMAVRLFMLSAHYRSPLNFSADLMEASKNGLERIVNAADNLKFLMGNAKAEAITDAEAKNFAKTEEFVAGFEKAMDDDFNTADAVAAIFNLVKYINTTTDAESSKEYLQKLFDLLVKLTGVLGLIVDKKEEILDEDIEKLIEERQAARKAKDFARADAIRDELLEKGIILKDTREGVQWKRA